MWPQHILDRIARIEPNTTIKNDYYGVFNRILNNAVGVPTTNFPITYVVNVNDLPILFLEIKPPHRLKHISHRVDSDTQMRARFVTLNHPTPTPRLHGISVMGQRLAFYCMDKATGHVNPKYVAPSIKYITDTVPGERWEIDITTEEGYQRFMVVIDDVKQMAKAL